MKNPNWLDLENLILVAGHAVYIASDFSNPTADDSWFLQNFQKGEPPYYIEHIRSGIDLLSNDSKSLLVFSGGQTRAEAGPKSEAQSYWLIAEHFNWWFKMNVKHRVTIEEFARDSFENLLFGICRFYEVIGKFPKKITVVSWAFKETRFNLHRQDISFPESCFEYIGVNNPVDLVGATVGEKKAIADFTEDHYGTRINQGEKDKDGKLIKYLGDKRDERNPFTRQHPYIVSCPELEGLLQYKGKERFNGSLSWTKD